MSFQTGLVSITFRQLSPEEIVELVHRAKLEAIEWGGDVHVPHGEVATARRVARLTREGGLQVAAYGSYYRVGEGEEPFASILETADALGAPRIRVWAGRRGSEEADAAHWHRVVKDGNDIASAAEDAGIPVVFEYHANTLTDTWESTLRLLSEIDHPNVMSYWQPPRYSRMGDNLEALARVLPWLSGLHVFNWHKESGERLPLSAAEEEWLAYLELATTAERDLVALVEFVVDDRPGALLEDGAALRGWISGQKT